LSLTADQQPCSGEMGGIFPSWRHAVVIMLHWQLFFVPAVDQDKSGPMRATVTDEAGT